MTRADQLLIGILEDLNRRVGYLESCDSTGTWSGWDEHESLKKDIEELEGLQRQLEGSDETPEAE